MALTPAEYRNEKVTDDTKQYYDYRDFADPKSITDSIMAGEPIVANLNVMDEFINRGYKIGILTARGHEDTVYETLREWLMYRDKEGRLTWKNKNTANYWAVKLWSSPSPSWS